MLHDSPNLGDQKYIDVAIKTVKAFKNRFAEKLSQQHKLVIAISGESGSGKTTIAYQLSKQLMYEFKKEGNSINVKHLYADNFYIENYRMDNPAKREQKRKAQKYENIGADEYDWKMINNIIHCFLNGYICRMPCVDVLNQQIDYLETNFKQVDILVFDGLYAIDKRMNSDFRFFIDGTYYENKNWGKIRQQYIDEFVTFESLRKYALKVIEANNSSQEQDIRGKEKLTEARIILLEKEHEAIQKMLDSLRSENYEISILKYN